MNKLILTAAIAALTASAATSAATVYEKDDLTLKLEGDYQVQAYQEIGSDKDLDVDYDDLELKFGVHYDLGNNMTAFGQLDLDWNGQGDSTGEETINDDIVDEAYVGLKIGNLSTSIGRQYWGSDDFGVEKAYEMDGGNAFPTTGGNDTIKFAYNMGKFGAVLSHDLEENNDEEATDLSLTTTLGKANVGFVYQDYQATPTTDSVETYGLMTSFDAGRANIGLDYSTNDDADYTNAAVSFPVANKTTAAVGATLMSPDSGDDVVQWYFNGTHKLHKNVNLFAEIGDNDADDSDMGYLAGMQVKF